MQEPVGIIDLGGQYTHMIGRRLRDLGVAAEFAPDDLTQDQYKRFSGFILSGGPHSVYDPEAPKVAAHLIDTHKPILGICYGHQLLAQMMGSTVQRGEGEFGPAQLLLQAESPSKLFEGTPPRQRVWMSHHDAVTSLPKGFTALARTERCAIAAYGNEQRKLYGIQFHPEVDHSDYGSQLLENFARRVCGLTDRVSLHSQVASQLESIRRRAKGKSVFFFVSGGVDSMVAFSMCAKALGRERVLGVYIDTGLMREGETEDLYRLVEKAGLGDRLVVKDEAERFLAALAVEHDPEAKRHIIGKCFIDVQSKAFKEFGVDGSDWLLGQGTIYPDTIESGGTSKHAAVIKTHHNRCAEVLDLMSVGLVIEPLADYYKDEVRAIGKEIGLHEQIVQRWPFPGPGLAIRCLCASETATFNPTIKLPSEFSDYKAIRFPVRSVGAQGDFRTYRDAMAVYGKLKYERLGTLAGYVYGHYDDFNRVIVHLAGALPSGSITVKKSYLDTERLARLREVDAIVQNTMREAGAYSKVWQFPVIMAPVSFTGIGESVILRPVNSEDGMTANFSRLPEHLLRGIASEIAAVDGVDAVFLDVSDKPPATIEWE